MSIDDDSIESGFGSPGLGPSRGMYQKIPGLSRVSGHYHLFPGDMNCLLQLNFLLYSREMQR